MEQHPVPRNISGFQFHLIGDMTLKQFVYLAAGATIAVLAYKLFPFPPLITYPFCLTAAFLGIAFAFIPIQERPLDRWLLIFLKSINSPTQYVWAKEGAVYDILLSPGQTYFKPLPQKHQEFHSDAKNKLDAYLKTLPASPQAHLNVQEQQYINSTLRLFNTVTPANTPTANQPDQVLSDVPIVNSTAQIPKITPVVVKPPITPKAQPAANNPLIPANTINAPVPAPAILKPATAPLVTDTKTFVSPSVGTTVKPTTHSPQHNYFEEQLKKLAFEKEKLEQELLSLRSSLTQAKKQVNINQQIQPPIPQAPTIKTVSPKTAVDEVGLPSLPQTPNLVIGIIKDADKKLLPNIIVTIKDEKGLPLRALKTNKLGQFAAATPLSNGVYLLEAEDPFKRYHFDTAKITLSGKVFLPIEITAKGEKEIMREKLTKELFGNTTVS